MGPEYIQATSNAIVLDARRVCKMLEVWSVGIYWGSKVTVISLFCCFLFHFIFCSLCQSSVQLAPVTELANMSHYYGNHD